MTRRWHSHLCAMLPLLFVLLCHMAWGAQSDTDRLAKLKAARKSTRTGLIPMTPDSFQDFIEAAPRSYGMVVMFSAPPSLCQPCASMSQQFSRVASEYFKLPSKRTAPSPLFFAEVKLSQSDQVFLSQYEIRHVPLLYYFAPGRTKTYPRPLKEDSPQNYPIQRVGIGANTIKQFINELARSRLTIVRGNYQIPFVQTVKAFQPLILSLVAAFAAIAVYTGAYKNPMLWFGIVMLVYIFSVGGGHYSWIHDVPLAVVNKEGRTEYMASGSRSQYVAEGFFVSVTCVSISALVILIQELPSVMPNKAGQTVVGTSLCMMTILAITALLVMYHFKMPQYLQYNELS